ncbi:hypothetical protein EBR96_05940 [bacterium]|nr:hypothetical protein [bacterium]
MFTPDQVETMKRQIQEDVTGNKVILYMKGDKSQPMCGFSAQVVQILTHLNVEFETRNVLADEIQAKGVHQGQGGGGQQAQGGPDQRRLATISPEHGP